MFDLHYWPTPNGKKVTILLEECGAPYTIVPVNIGRGDQFTPEFLKMNPNHRMPVLVDRDPADGGAPIAVFESGAIMMYIAEKLGKFWPAGRPRQIRGHPVADLADGQPGPQARRVRAFPPAGRQAGRPVLRRAPFHRRGEPPVWRAEQPAVRPAIPGRQRIHHRRHDRLSLDGELEGPRPGHRGIQILQALVRGDRRPPGRAARHGGRRQPVRGPVEAVAARSRRAAPRSCTTSAPARFRRKGGDVMRAGLAAKSGPRSRSTCDAGEGGAVCTTLTRLASLADLSREERER